MSKRKVLVVVGLILSHLACVVLGVGVMSCLFHKARMVYFDHTMALGWTSLLAWSQFNYGTPDQAFQAQTKYLGHVIMAWGAQRRRPLAWATTVQPWALPPASEPRSRPCAVSTSASNHWWCLVSPGGVFLLWW